MPDYLVKGYKSVMCHNNHIFEIPIQTTITKCPICDDYVIIGYFGAVVDMNDNNVF